MRCDPHEVVRATLPWIGTPYRHQASTIAAGCDCLGLLRGVWRSLNGAEPEALPAYRADWRDQASAGALQRAADTHLLHVASTPTTGDVVLFRLHRRLPPKHCAIMVSPTIFVHAQEQIGVVEANLSAAWSRRVAGVYQFPKRMEI